MTAWLGKDGLDRPLAIAVALVFFSQLGAYGLLEPDEGRYAEIAREMAAAEGSWLIPTLNDVPHFQKPPLLYWLTAVSMKCFGINEFAARLPSALAALVTVVLTVRIARRLFPGPWVGPLALLILASTPLFWFLGRTLTPDMLMTAWITAAVYCLVRSRQVQVKSGIWGWGFFICIGLGFLTKGPVAFLVPMAAAIGWRWRLRDGSLRLPWWRGVALAILIGLSWFLVVAVKHPSLAEYFWKYELLDRFTSGAHGRSRPFWFFVPVLLAGFLPWTVIAVRGLPQAWRFRSNPEFGVFVGWIAVPFVVLSVSGSKLPTYILPLLPGLAVLVAAGVQPWIAERKPLSRVATGSMISVLLLLALVPLVVGNFVLEPSAGGGVSMGSIVAVGIGLGFGVLVWRRSRENGGIALLWLAAGLIAVWSVFPSQVSAWNDLLAQQACVGSLAQRIESDSAGGPRRVIACEIRAHGLAFALGESVEITRQEAEVMLPEGVLDGGLPPLHRGPKDVSRIGGNADGGVAIYVVTRTGRYRRDFAGKGWRCLQTAGDFVLLRRELDRASK